MITSIHLRTEFGQRIVSVEIDGVWYKIIETFADNISHFSEVRNKSVDQLTRDDKLNG